MLKDAVAGAITTTIAVSNYLARSGNRILLLRLFDFIVGNPNEFEFMRAFCMTPCFFRRLFNALPLKLHTNAGQGALYSAEEINVVIQVAFFCLHWQALSSLILCFSLAYLSFLFTSVLNTSPVLFLKLFLFPAYLVQRSNGELSPPP